MTNSPTNSIPNTTSRVNHFTGLARRRRKFSLLPANGDGSTLNLDFTTGVLDPRLTFTRASDATFINSSGLVQYADANYVQNSTMLNNTGAKWTQTTSGGSVTINGDGTVRFNGTSGRATWLQSIDSLATGLPITFSFRVTSFTNTNLRTTDLFNAGNGFTGQAYHYTDTNGTTHTLGAFESLPKSGTSGVGTYSVTATTTASTPRNIIFGSDCNGVGGRNGDVTITEPQLQYGTVVPRRVYVPNSSIIAAKWDSARFDHDPTTLAPRGLAMEGTATNLVTNSSSMWNWGTSGVTKAQDTAIQDIAGQTGTSNITAKVDKASGSGAQFHTLQAAIPSITVPANTIVDVTCSVWIRMNSAGQPRCSLGIFDSSGTPSFGAAFGTQSPGGQSVSNSSVTMSSYSSADCDYTFGSVTGWVRCSVSRRLNNTTASPINWTTGLVLIYPDRFTTNAATIYVCGAQVETGIGPSSWIPTGASQVQRLRDEVVLSSLPGIAFNQSAGTIYSQLEIVEKLRGAFVPYGSFDTSGGGRCWWWLRHNHDASVGQRILGTAFNSGGSTAITSSNYTHSSGVFKFATSLDPVAGRMVYAIAGGSAQVTNASGFTLATAAQMSLNKNSDVAATDLGSMWVRSIKYWPTALPDATLQSLTT